MSKRAADADAGNADKKGRYEIPEDGPFFDLEAAEARVPADVHAKVTARRGKMANILRVHGLVPKTMEGHMHLYETVVLQDDPPLPLARVEREAIAKAVSEANECPYCVAHHGDAMEKAKPKDFEPSPKLEKLIAFAVKIAKEPYKITKRDHERLRDEAGCSEDEVFLTVMIASYFSMANRIAFACGLPIEEWYQETTS